MMDTPLNALSQNFHGRDHIECAVLTYQGLFIFLYLCKISLYDNFPGSHIALITKYHDYIYPLLSYLLVF